MTDVVKLTMFYMVSLLYQILVSKESVIKKLPQYSIGKGNFNRNKKFIEKYFVHQIKMVYNKKIQVTILLINGNTLHSKREGQNESL